MSDEKDDDFMKGFKEMQEKIKKGELDVEDIMAETDGMESFGTLFDEFFSRVITHELGIPWAFVSDFSSIYDFCSNDEEMDAVKNRIMEIYGVDISPVEDGNIVKILKLITQRKIH